MFFWGIPLPFVLFPLILGCMLIVVLPSAPHARVIRKLVVWNYPTIDGPMCACSRKTFIKDHCIFSEQWSSYVLNHA